MPKIESENQFPTSVKSHNSVLICQNLPIFNPKTLLPNINSYTKFEEKWLQYASDRKWKRSPDGRTDRRTDTRTQILNGGYNMNTLHFLKWQGVTSYKQVRVMNTPLHPTFI